ncbi:hypothetical protein D1871_10800 [Nakamurella silvestris]|nr:hypothetical protein D1871_10800 [Nakamurella silvestris]
MAIFAVGIVSIGVSLVLFATGRTDLPLWINLVSMLAPVGLAVGLVGVIREAKASSPALKARKLEKESAKAKAAGDPSEEWNLPDLASNDGAESSNKG